MELETLKVYLKTYLKTRLIWPSKSLAEAPIFFYKNSDDRLHLCINYQGLNNMTINNWYPLLLIGKSRDKLDYI